ncbi:hypothetical protein TNCV_2769951 [Trichonephila clavipes]|nr:hypothetical protein TNCV_2769951 [Trichonephila clavipes]
MDAGPERPNGRIPRPNQKYSLFQHQVDSRMDLATHPGADGICRVVTIQTSSGVITRPVSQVAVLPPTTVDYIFSPSGGC